MALQSSIEWTEATWNPITGCSKISPGCRNCYAERMAKRLKAMGQKNYSRGFEVQVHDHCAELPLQWKKPQMIFVNSMSDLFHEAVPDDFILRIFGIMAHTPWHRFQILTKRSDRLKKMSSRIPWMPHIWMGVSMENENYQFRLDDLVTTGAHLKFLSLEPLLGPLKELHLGGIDWVIAGGESGPHARPMEPSWVINIRDQCTGAEVPFFFKQWGGMNKKKNGRLLEGRTWDEMPAS
ncbi:MAG: phage Gp37/Gp68 family protein [Candidatus Eremiobacteraeota bacterium]|nr:phage Gp37/Gp68 family protein [Candidatus Eremiobacteraeota bacterium]